MESALRESEERFKNAFEFAPIGKALVGLDGKFLRVNRGYVRLWDMSLGIDVPGLQTITIPTTFLRILDHVRQLCAEKSASMKWKSDTSTRAAGTY